ncbi:MAG: hypothetical protein WAU58_02400 [Terriglobales bacterium]|jgi:hypothetical protein
MKKMFIVICAVVLIGAFASAQISRTSSGSTKAPSPAVAPSWCSPCLWYAGDYDTTNPNQDGLWNADTSAYYGIVGQVYVPILPQAFTVPIKHGVQTKLHNNLYSISINEDVTNFGLGASDFAGAVYDIRKNLGGNPGYAGVSVASGTCLPTTPVDTGVSIFSGAYEQYLITCTFPTPISVSAGTELWVSVLPAFDGGDYGFLGDSIDMPPLNGFNSGNDGYWPNVIESSYFNSASFGASYVPATTQGPGFDAFSIGVTGVYK